MRPWGEYLAEQGYAVSVPRLPGHGTTWQDCNTTTHQDWTTAVDRAFDALAAECDRVFVAGLSMGGTLATRLAEVRPDDVVLVTSAAGGMGVQQAGLLEPRQERIHGAFHHYQIRFFKPLDDVGWVSFFFIVDDGEDTKFKYPFSHLLFRIFHQERQFEKNAPHRKHYERLKPNVFPCF